MTRRLDFIPPVVLAVVLLSASSIAQSIPGDDGVLYFPPKLKIRAAATDDLRAARLSEDDRQGPIAIELRERSQAELLLPLIFFDGAGSTTIPDRYQVFHSSMETDTYFDSSDVVNRLNNVGHPKYLQLLNILGYRMTAFPESRIELEGGYSTLPGENAEVGGTRAEVIRDYLTTIWHVDPERIALRTPRRICDSSDNILRQEEAQRVEIYTSDTNLLRHVQYFEIQPGETLLYFNILLDPSTNSADVTGIELALSLGDEIISSTQIPVHPDSTVYRLHGLWPAFQLSMEREEEMIVQAFVRTLQGTTRPSNSVRFTIGMTPEESREHDADPYAETFFFLPFSEWRDSTLSAAQQYYLDEYIAAFKADPNNQADGTYILGLNGSGDLSEQFEIDRATIETTRAFKSFESRTLSTLTERRSRFPMVFFSQGEEGERPDIYPFLRAWFGDEYVNESERQREDRDEGRMTSDENPYQTFDSVFNEIVIGRTGPAARYIRERLPEGMIDSIEVDPEYYTPLTHRLLPEERYYARGIEITFYRPYDYSDEYYDDEEGVPEEEYEGEGYEDEEYPEEE